MIASISQFKIIIALSLTLAACCAGMAPAAAGFVVDPWNNHSDKYNCNNTGYRLDTCSKTKWCGLFKGTCKPTDPAHLKKWHLTCPICDPQIRVTRRRLATQDEMLNGVISGVRNQRKESIIQQRMQWFYSKKNERPSAYELVQFVKSDFVKNNIDEDFTPADAFKYLRNFVPSRRRLGVWQSFIDRICGNVGREVKIQRGMQRLYKCLGKKPEPHVLMDLLNANKALKGTSGLEPPLTKTEAFEYLIAFKPSSHRRLPDISDMKRNYKIWKARAAAIEKEITHARSMQSKTALRSAKYRLMEEWDLNDSELEAIIAIVCPRS